MLQNLNEYNCKYDSQGILQFKKIGEPIDKKGKHFRKRKIYPKIDINKIKLPNDPEINFDYLAEINEEYCKSHKLPPVLLSFDLHILAGFEIAFYAKTNNIKRIPYQPKKPSQSVSAKPNGNKRYHIKADNGSTIFISLKRWKRIRELQRLCETLKYDLRISVDLEYTIIDSKGNIIYDHNKQRGKIIKTLKQFINVCDDKKDTVFDNAMFFKSNKQIVFQSN